MKIYKDRYLVSPCANIYDTLKKKWLTHYKHSAGYVQVLIHSRREYLHRIVAQCYPMPYSNTLSREIDHIDSVKSHNCFLNLEWVTKSENIKRSFQKGLNYTPIDRIRKMVVNRRNLNISS